MLHFSAYHSNTMGKHAGHFSAGDRFSVPHPGIDDTLRVPVPQPVVEDMLGAPSPIPHDMPAVLVPCPAVEDTLVSLSSILP